MRWFYFQAGSLCCWVQARSMEDAARLGIRACKEAYSADVGHYYQCSTADKFRPGQAERDNVIKGVYWDKM